ncbi:MAG TPA: polyprenol monophosphomannose synthase [Candidatus Acidoferrum sp.]|nr:polyprenol monophosphomannose synthase [Candidatus Angelobacter sp.]HXD82719.1 polyprenol monophosphomannose synthase [Candidatus Acidoferrum sp.]
MSSESRVTERRQPPTEVLVVLPTYNESQNVEKVVSGVRYFGHDVLIVDDASPDGTGEVADGIAAKDPGVRVLHRPRKLGLGSAYEDAFRLGLAEGSSLFVEMDADGSHLPQDLESIVDAARGCGGLAIGSRYIRGGQIVGWPPHRWLLSWAANFYCRTLLGLKTRDCTSGYRCYTRELLQQIRLDEVLSQGYSFQIEMVHRTKRLGYPIVEVPIRFEDRVAGASKVSRGEVRRALWTVFRLSLAR